MTTMLTTTTPRTGEVSPTDLQETSTQEFDRIATGAQEAFDALFEWSRGQRAALLDTVADAVEARRPELVATANRETALGTTRLDGELSRSVFQLRLFAEAVRDGGYLEAAIDHEEATPLGPGPDIRRMLVPIGPVAAFGASNFPFAFSILGGDTASALAAGCPVVLKAHPSHPLTSQLSFAALQDGLRLAGAPARAIGVVYGTDAGIALVSHPTIRAAALTGSVNAARAIHTAIDARDEPIPFFAELSSLIPVLITPRAAEHRAVEIADGLYTSVTGSGGQLCTKPGIVLVPAGVAGDLIVDALAKHVTTAQPAVLLNERIRDSFNDIHDRLVETGVRSRGTGLPAQDDGSLAVAAHVLEVHAKDFGPGLTEEAFGPLVLLVRYETREEAIDVITQMPGSLTATVQGQPDEQGLPELFQALSARAGRLIFNGYPTGVRVSWAQHHGGPWPATNSQHLSRRHCDPALATATRLAEHARSSASSRTTRRIRSCPPPGRRQVPRTPLS